MQKAKITVSGVSRNSEGVSRLETVNTGTFTEKNGYCYARYEEAEASGMSGTTTTVKWNSSQVSLIRHGAYEMQQEFAEGGTYAGDYRTPYTYQKAALWLEDSAGIRSCVWGDRYEPDHDDDPGGFTGKIVVLSEKAKSFC